MYVYQAKKIYEIRNKIFGFHQMERSRMFEIFFEDLADFSFEIRLLINLRYSMQGFPKHFRISSSTPLGKHPNFGPNAEEGFSIARDREFC